MLKKKRPGRRPKAKEDTCYIPFTLHFTPFQWERLNRAVKIEHDVRATWARRKLMEAVGRLIDG